MKHNSNGLLRRPVAMLLAVLMILSMVPVYSAAPADSESTPQAGVVTPGKTDAANLITDGCFDADLTGWKSVPVGGYTGYLTWENFAAHLKTQDIFSMEHASLVEVKPSGTYSFCVDAELSDGAELAAYISYYTAEGYSADIPYERVSYTRNPGTQQCSGEFTVPADCAQISITFVLQSYNGLEVTAVLDNVAVYYMSENSGIDGENMPVQITAYDPMEQMLLKSMRNTTQFPDFMLNVSFDDGTEQPWKLWSGATISNGAMTQSADSNGYAEGTQKYAVESGKTYTISAKIKAEGRSQAVYWLYEYNSAGRKLANKPITKFFGAGSDGWVDFIYEYTPGANVTAVLFHIQTNEGKNLGGSIAWDYVKVTVLGDEPEITEPEVTEPEVTEPEVTEPEVTEPTQMPEFALDVSFDDGKHPWKLWSAATVADGIMTQSADSNGYAEGLQYYTVEAGKTYVISAKIKAEGRSQAVYWIYEYNANGGKIRNVPLTKFFSAGSNGWVDFISEYTPSANVASVQLHVQANEGQNKGGFIQWDYIKVEKKEEEPPITEPTEPEVTEPEVTEPEVTEPTEMPKFALNISFDDGNHPWNLWSGASVANGMMTQSADSNGYAEGIQKYAVQPGKTYVVSAKIQAIGKAQAIFWFWEYDAGGTKIGSIPATRYYTSGSGGWVDFTYEYTPSQGAEWILFHIQTNEGQNQGGTVQWDSITVSEKEDVPVVPDTCIPPNGNFEHGEDKWTFLTQGSGSYSIETDENGKYVKGVLGSSGQIYAYSQQVSVKPDYIYTISYKVKVTPDSTENLKTYGAITTIQEFSGGKTTGYSQNSSARNQTDGWETVTYEFITSSNAEAIRIDFMYANNPGMVFWDDFCITEKEAYEPVLLDAKYDHGGTADTASVENIIPNSTFDGGIIQGWNPKEGISAVRTANENGGVVQFYAKPGSYLQSNWQLKV